MSLVTKLIPLFVLILVTGVLAVETYCDCDVDLESYIPLIIAMGIGGIPLTIIKRAIDAKKAIDTERIKESIKNNNNN